MSKTGAESLRDELASRIAPVVLSNITTHYPYHDSHLFKEGDGPAHPMRSHPAFGNSFDWHSSVHSHWTATQLLAHFAASKSAPAIAEKLEDALHRNLTAEHLTEETAYLAASPWYERPYGWAWALKLGAAVMPAPTPKLHSLSEPLRKLAERIRGNALSWLKALPVPVRHGVHGNTAFSLGLMLDASRALSFVDLADLITERARAWFAHDRDYPYTWERSGNDFLSPGLAEADLMRRIVSRREFGNWWQLFLPGIGPNASLFAAAPVPNINDGHIAHLHGLNLSRAGMIARIAAELFGERDAIQGERNNVSRYIDQAEALYRGEIDATVGDDYLSTHWLATFAWDAASSIDNAKLVLQLT